MIWFPTGCTRWRSSMGLEEEQSRTRLLATMDQLNDKYGMSTLAPAAMLTAYKAAPTRIAFHSIPDLF